MKNTELFDILGNIDDKFYDEALGGDSERPMEISIKKPAFSIRNVLMPVAACLAVAAGIGVTAHFLSRADFISPDPSTSNTASDPIDVALANPNITEADIEECRALLNDRYPDLERYLGDNMTLYFFRTADIDFDGCDEVLAVPNVSGYRSLLIFEKTVDGMAVSGGFSVEDGFGPYILHKYELDGERYWYFYKSKMLALPNDEGICVNYLARLRCDEGIYSVENTLCYGYTYDDKNYGVPKQWFFNTECPELSELTEIPSSNITPEEFKEKWEKHTDLPKFEYYATFEEEYPLLSEVEIPVVESVYRPDESVAKARLTSVDMGEYELWLTANDLFKGDNDTDPNRFWAFSLGLCMVKDGKIVSADGVNFMSNAHDGAAMFYIDPNEINSFFKIYHLNDCDLLVFGMVNREDFGWESNFFGIKDGVVTKLFGLDGHGWFVNAPLDLENGGYNILIDTENSIRYEFHPDDFEGNPYEKPHFIKSDYISTNDYPMYNGKAAEKVTLCKKMIGGETVRLLAHNAEPVTVDGVERVKFSELFLSMDASKGTSGWVKQIGLIGGPGFITARLDDYLTTIEFNDGKKLIAVYQSFDEGSVVREYAVFYDASNGNAFHAGPPNGASIVSGDHWYLGTNYTVSDTDRSITLDYGEVMVFDFDKVQFYNPELQ